jgi:hypothetical protein
LFINNKSRRLGLAIITMTRLKKLGKVYYDLLITGIIEEAKRR